VVPITTILAVLTTEAVCHRHVGSSGFCKRTENEKTLQNWEVNLDALHCSMTFSLKDLLFFPRHASQHVACASSFSLCIKSSLCWWDMLIFKKSVALESLVLKNPIDFKT